MILKLTRYRVWYKRIIFIEISFLNSVFEIASGLSV